MKRKAELIARMRKTNVPMRAYNDIVVPAHALRPGTDLMCLPAKDGLIQGRMDWHVPLFWINGFAWRGLSRTAELARELGENEFAETCENEANELLEKSAVGQSDNRAAIRHPFQLVNHQSSEEILRCVRRLSPSSAALAQFPHVTMDSVNDLRIVIEDITDSVVLLLVLQYDLGARRGSEVKVEL